MYEHSLPLNQQRKVVVVWHLFFFFSRKQRTQGFDDCTLTRSLVPTNYKAIFTHIPVKQRAG